VGEVIASAWGRATARPHVARAEPCTAPGPKPVNSLRWWGYKQLKRPFFGRFMKPWRWPQGVPMDGWQSVRIASDSHAPLAAVHRNTSHPAQGVVVLAHPMGLACKGFWLRGGHADRLLAAGFHVLAFDFNGFGESPSTNFDWPADVIAAGQFARRHWPGLPVHAVAASFGAMRTLDAIDRPNFPFDRVVAEGCAPSLPQFWRHYPMAYAVLQTCRPLMPGLEEMLRPTAHVAAMKLSTRLLLIHSQADTWTPVAHGEALAAAAPQGAHVQRLVLQSAEHTHGLRDEPDVYWPAVHAFLTAAA
jgi:uncharacterized protein